jgi:integrase
MFGFCLTHRRLSVGASLAITPERGIFARQAEKSHKGREGPLVANAYLQLQVPEGKRLARRPVASDWVVFTRFDGRGGASQTSPEPLRRTSAWRIVQRYTEPIELEHVKPHDFRRFVGTELT